MKVSKSRLAGLRKREKLQAGEWATIEQMPCHARVEEGEVAKLDDALVQIRLSALSPEEELSEDVIVCSDNL